MSKSSSPLSCFPNSGRPSSSSNQPATSRPVEDENYKFKQLSINRVRLPAYPQTDGRSFRSQWYDQFKWLEYHPEKDVCFCFACRTFGTVETKEKAYTELGFRTWKKALDRERGFHKHESSQAHKICMGKWTEQQLRISRDAEIGTLVNENVLEKNRYYIKVIFDIIKFLVINELPLRGTYNKEEKYETGLFYALFQYTLEKDPKLQECIKLVPKNAKYTSPLIQNEVIGIMSDAIKNKISEEVNSADVPFYSIMADGTRDRNNAEAISVALRYIFNGILKESILSVEEAEKLDAEYLSDLILQTLKNHNVKFDNMLSQCYDGASVMSGNKGGIRALIQKKLKRKIPYLHCFNHQLHLIVIALISAIFYVRQFFDYCRLIHKIFSTFKFKSFYDGHSTARLLETRWTGHLNTITIIFNNYEKMLTALSTAVLDNNGELDGDAVVECRGLLAIMKTQRFQFILRTMLKLLSIIEPADKILQSRESGLMHGIPVIRAVFDSLKSQRSDDVFNSVLNESENLLPYSSNSSDPDDPDPVCTNDDDVPAKKRKITSSTRLTDFVIMSTSGNNDRTSNTELNTNFRQIYFEIYDVTIAEFENRFFRDDPLIEAIDKVGKFDFDLHDAHNSGQAMKGMKIFTEYGIKLPSVEELICVQNFFRTNNIKNLDYLKELFKYKNAFKDTYEFYASVAIFACSSAVCESSFSTLNRVVTPYRQSMLFNHEANLTLLSHERKYMLTVADSELLRMFNASKNRNLQLF